VDAKEGNAELFRDLHDKSRFLFGVEVDTSVFLSNNKRGIVVDDFHGVIIAKDKKKLDISF
jgi:hypothetical protein